MRRIAIVAAVLAVLAAMGVAAPGAHAGCAFIVVWHDRAYIQYSSPAQTSTIEPGATITGAVEPGCNDTVGADEHPTATAARRIVGISPAVAILVRGTPLVAWGYVPATGFLTGATVPHDETRGCTLGGRVRITGPAHLGLGLLNVTVNDTTVRLRHLLNGAAQMFSDGYTRIDGLKRNGLPYIGEGQLVRVDARFCKVPGSVGTKIVARHIVATGPIVAPSTAEDILGADWRGRPDVVSSATGGHSLAVAIVILVAGVVVGTILTRHRRRSLPPPTG
jgi:Family of unknown function (DUF6281)